MTSFENLLAMRKEIIIGTKYRIIRKIGHGGFGDVYLGEKIANGEHVAIKVEPIKAGSQGLPFEYKVYRKLLRSVGIPLMRWYGCSKGHNILVMDLLGPSLEDLFNFCSRKFSMKTVLMLADQMIERVEFIHSKGFLHRDIKPDNFLMGVGRHCNELYMIDFGLAKEFHNPPHGSGQSKPGMVGTARYASINALGGYEQSWRDDLESLGYVIIYFSRGSLPWQGTKGNTEMQTLERIKEKKTSMPIEELVKGYPQEMAVYLRYCRSLTFTDPPDYRYLRNLFQTLFSSMGFEFDYAYDFTTQLKRQSTENTEHPMDTAQQPSPNEPDAENAGRASGDK